MNQKLLWKIEELWKKYHIKIKPTTSNIINMNNILENYINGVSRYYDQFCYVDSFDFLESKNIVFKDDYGEYDGLEKCQVLKKNNKLIYLFDNHNEIIYPLLEIFEASNHTYDIVHIDAHPDDAVFPTEKPHHLEMAKVQDFISQTRISDFFDAVSETDIIGGIHRVTHSDSLEFFLPPKKPYILSLDIDIFGPEGDFAELKDKLRAIALAWNNAEAVCIAMSPGFIDQKYAQKIIEIFMK